MATTTDYCLRADITARMTEAGVAYHADDDNNGVVEEANYVASVDKAIQRAGNKINAALVAFFPVPLSQDDASLNPYLQDLAVDIACAHLASRDGGSIPISLAEARDMALADLQEIAGGKRVPGLTYPGDGFTEERRDFGRPLVVNPLRRTSHRCRR